MRISVLAVGTRMPNWVDDGVREYARRMPPQIQFSVDEISPGQRTGRGSVKAAREQEAAQLKKRMAACDLTIALDERGKQWTSTELATEMRGWLQDYPKVALLIGGPDGFSADVRDSVDRLWSLSPMTLPHGLVRVVLAEQIYRAWTIVDGHPYHREGP